MECKESEFKIQFILSAFFRRHDSIFELLQDVTKTKDEVINKTLTLCEAEIPF